VMTEQFGPSPREGRGGNEGMMANHGFRRLAALAGCLLLLAALAGCASSQAFKLGRQAEDRKDWDMAVLHYSKALDERPDDVQIQIGLEKSKIEASDMHFERGKVHLASGNLDAAIMELQQAVNLHPANQFAFLQLQKAVKQLQERRAEIAGTPEELSKLERLKRDSKRPIGSPPKLDPASDVEISIKFEEEDLDEILSAIGAIYGINFLYDDTARKDSKLSVNLTGVSFEDALELIMLQSGNDYTVISENTLMVYPNTQSKQREWQDQVIKTFYLSNADVNDVNSLLRTLIESRRVSINKQLNAISIRDTLDKIAIADRIIQANDKAKAEVIIDVELYQVDRSLLQTLGIDLQPKTMVIGFDNAGSGVRLNYLNPLFDLGSWILAPIPSITLDFLRQSSLSRALARPKIRATEGERVSIHMGDQVPIPNTTFSASQTVGGNIVPITSYTYQNVGIQIQLEPRVHHNREVTLRMELEVSRITSINDAGQPTIGTRQVSTVIRLKDGETNLLAGLFLEEDVKGLSTIPGLDNIPGVRNVFGTRNRSLRQTDILLTITPHIIRIPDITESDLRPLWVGTERNIRMRNKGALPGGYGEGPFSQEAADEAWGLFRQESNVVPPGEIDRLLRESREAGQAPILQEPAATPEPAAAPPPPEPEPEPESSRSSRVRVSAPGTERAGVARTPPSQREAPSGGGGGVSVRLNVTPPSAQVAVGGTTRLQLRLDTGGRGVVSLPFYVRFDPQVVSLQRVEEGPFLSSTGRSVLFQTDIQEGRAIVGAALTGTGPGVSGEGHVATLVFSGRAAGRSAVTLERVHPMSDDGQILSIAVAEGSITVR